MAKKPWMTPDAEGLLARVEADEKWDLLPILADALEEGGYPDGETLLAMRDPDQTAGYLGQEQNDFRWLKRLVNGEIIFHDVRAAVDFFIHHAREFGDCHYDEDDSSQVVTAPEDFGWLLEVYDTYASTGAKTYLSYETPDAAWEARDVAARHYLALTGVELEKKTLNGLPDETELYTPAPFRCAC